jgi:ribonuclease Z
VYGIAPALAQARRAWECFDTAAWEGVPPIEWHPVAHQAGAEVLRNARWRVSAAPGIHPVPVVGLRVEASGGGVVAYSCDTHPSPDITTLARGADLLLHEAQQNPTPVHSTYEQAARVARDAGVSRLVLVHLPPGARDEHLAGAREIFPHTQLGEDGGRHEF